MNILIWNCYGAAKKGFRRAIRYMIRHHKIDILVLSETKISGGRADDICSKLGYSGCHRVEALRRSGGFWILWHADKFSLSVIAADKNRIHAEILNHGSKFHLFAIYAPATYEIRKDFWPILEEEIIAVDGPCFVGGDFNCILYHHERAGGSSGLHRDSDLFAEFINNCEVTDMGFVGPAFTWTRGLEASNAVYKRLDRVLINIDGRLH